MAFADQIRTFVGKECVDLVELRNAVVVFLNNSLEFMAMDKSIDPGSIEDSIGKLVTVYMDVSRSILECAEDGNLLASMLLVRSQIAMHQKIFGVVLDEDLRERWQSGESIKEVHLRKFIRNYVANSRVPEGEEPLTPEQVDDDWEDFFYASKMFHANYSVLTDMYNLSILQTINDRARYLVRRLVHFSALHASKLSWILLSFVRQRGDFDVSDFNRLVRELTAYQEKIRSYDEEFRRTEKVLGI